MRRRLFGLLILMLFPSTAGAAPVVVLTPAGHAVHRNDRYLTTPAVTPTPSSPAVSAARSKPRARTKERTVRSELARLLKTHAITPAQYGQFSRSFAAALGSEKRLRGTRRNELEAVIQNLHNIAASGDLTPSRLPALFATLDHNREWWTAGPLLASGQRVEFSGSNLVWQYYPGQGIQLQVLGTFGKADGLYTAGRASYPQLVELMAEMIPLAAHRGGGLTWEYYFRFGGGMPPWTSAMSQGTGLEALTRAYLATHNASYLRIAEQALPIFSVAPKVGVLQRTRVGSRYLQYSFAPGADIINAFLQSLIGLYDYARTSGSARAQKLFAAGDAQARAELPRFDTGAWSLYQPGIEDSLSYHELVTGFLDQLCTKTHAPVYCRTGQHFHTYLTTPPTLALMTGRLKSTARSTVRFRLSKVSRVGIVLVRGTKTVFSTSAGFSHGVHTFSIPALHRRGTYSVGLAATDLAGNLGRITGTLVVS